jgi:hypothetical protein
MIPDCSIASNGLRIDCGRRLPLRTRSGQQNCRKRRTGSGGQSSSRGQVPIPDESGDCLSVCGHCMPSRAARLQRGSHRSVTLGMPGISYASLSHEPTWRFLGSRRDSFALLCLIPAFRHSLRVAGIPGGTFATVRIHQPMRSRSGLGLPGSASGLPFLANEVADEG